MVDSGAYDPNASYSRSIHTTILNDDLHGFTTMDHASLLGLGHLDIAGMGQLCALKDVGDVSVDMLIEGASGWGGGGGNGDGDGDNGDGGVIMAMGGNGDGGVEASGCDNPVGF